MPERQPRTPAPVTEREGVFDLERWLATEFSQQYDEQTEMLNRLGMIELLAESGEMGIVGIDGLEHLLPSKEKLMAEIRGNPEKYETKIKQGFGQLLLVPFALSLKQIVKKIESELKKYQDPQAYLYRSQEGGGFRIGIVPDEESPVSFAIYEDQEESLAMDVDERLLYYQNKTKKELLAEPGFSGWNILLVEDFPDIHKEYEEEVVGGRQQIPAGVTPENLFECLSTLPELEHEDGFTLEDYLSYFLLRLEKYNEVTDAWGMSCILLGSCLKESPCFLTAGWDDYNNNLGIKTILRGIGHPDEGCRTAVRVGELII